MVVIFEFLDKDPIENLVTCMRFKIDKVVFFGFQETIDDQKARTERFLREYCGVNIVVFHPVSHNDLQSMLGTMRKAVQYERGQKNRVFFDITGGESFIMVAFGMMSKEFDTPMHMFDVVSDKLIEIDDGAKMRISRAVEQRIIRLTIDMLIEMHGGRVNYSMQKKIKNSENEEFEKDVEEMYRIASGKWEYWNPFSALLRNKMIPDENLCVNMNAKSVVEALAELNTKLNTIQKLDSIVDALGAAGILLDVRHSDGRYSFRIKNEDIKACLWDGGSVLELHTFREEKIKGGECLVGVHIDWDGIFHSELGKDIVNEIDVLSLKGYVPTFISCKSGKMGPQQALHAMYELETVARRFGGKYAKKVLVSASEISGVYLDRAAEMGIEIR